MTEPTNDIQAPVQTKKTAPDDNGANAGGDTGIREGGEDAGGETSSPEPLSGAGPVLPPQNKGVDKHVHPPILPPAPPTGSIGEGILSDVDAVAMAETPETLAPHFGIVGIQRLFVEREDNVIHFAALPVEGLEGEPIVFDIQCGDPREEGVNGLTTMTLLRAALHALRTYEKGPMACEENARAINHINAGLGILCQRAADREERGVIGTLKV